MSNGGATYYNSGGLASKTKIRNSLMGRIGDSGVSLNAKSPQVNKKYRRDYNMGGINAKIAENSHYALNSSTSGLHDGSKGVTLSSKKNK